MHKMTEQEAVAILRKVLGAELGTIEMGKSLEEIGWDSLAQLSFLAELDVFGIRLSSEELSAVSTVEELIRLVQN